jgi:hypothetical protein
MADEGNVGGSNLYVVSQNDSNARVSGASLYSVSQVTNNARIFGSTLYPVSQVTNNGRIAGTLLYVVSRGLVPPTLSIPNITGTVGLPAFFDASGSSESAGNPTKYRWIWTSVPGSSTITNNSSSEFPDNGGLSWISMTGNEILLHAEDGTDSSGNGNSILFSGITLGSLSGKVGQYSWGYDNTSSRATISTPIDFSGDYSVSFWFYNLDSDGIYRSSMCASSGEFIPMIIDTSGQLGLWNGSFVGSGQYMYAVDFSGWHHAVITATGSITKWYIDGELYGECSAKVSQSLGFVGNNGFNNQRFAERIDEFSTWNRVLSEVEISSIYLFQSEPFANYGQTLTFIPDVPGTYQVTVRGFNGPIDYYDEVVAQAVISSAPGGLVIILQSLQGEFSDLQPLQGNINIQGGNSSLQ